jgi:hypothetical protein
MRCRWCKVNVSFMVYKDPAWKSKPFKQHGWLICNILSSPGVGIWSKMKRVVESLAMWGNCYRLAFANHLDSLGTASFDHLWIFDLRVLHSSLKLKIWKLHRPGLESVATYLYKPLLVSPSSTIAIICFSKCLPTVPSLAWQSCVKEPSACQQGSTPPASISSNRCHLAQVMV